MELNELIDRISYLRTRANLSARALSMKIGKDPSYIHMLENKRNFEPSISTLFDIIEACGSCCEEFFYPDITQYETDKKALLFFQALSKTQKEAIMNLYRIE